MKSLNRTLSLVLAMSFAPFFVTDIFAGDKVKIENGVIEGGGQPGSAVRSFKGIPFAQPPVGDLRWRAPQPVKNWTGMRRADQFGPRCMQRTLPTADYWFRSNGMSEDCLYLNVWTPAKSDRERLPVLVYIFGGGFQNGDGSEPRYDGANMASKGIVTVTVNYRLNIFGFFSHPELTKESPEHASGNYGLLDQAAALQWVHRNIAVFGGDPNQITIAGESAGSMSVSALMASPLSRDLIHGAIGESGALISSMPPRTVEETEQDGVHFAASAGASSLPALRAMTAEQVQDAMTKVSGIRFRPNLDGYFLPKPLKDIFTAGEQSKVPLLAGSNSEEQPARTLLGKDEPTPENFEAAVRKLYPDRSDEVLKAYAASTPEQVLEAARDLASARFVGHSTWKWTELQMKTGGKPVYRYLYAHPRPKFLAATNQSSGTPDDAIAKQPAPKVPRGAAHSAEIQYAMGNLPLDKRYAWEPADYKVSDVVQRYFVNFIQTGNPNGPGLPKWPPYTSGDNFQIMRLDINSHAQPESQREHYLVLDTLSKE